MVTFFKYQGSKKEYIDKINPLINNSKATTYIEPFVGSGAVFFNLEKEFDRYILNDLNSIIMDVYNTFKTSSYDIFKEVEQIATNKYDIKNNKEGFYEFRSKVNNISDKDIHNFGLFFLFNSCINSMVRFNKKGIFNQAYGNRYRTLTKNEFGIIQSKLKRAELYSCDFFDLDIPTDSLLFLDPPYIERPTSYQTIDEDFFGRLINFIKTTDNDVLYTDIDHDFLDLEKIIIRDNMVNTAPSSDKSSTNKTEVMFTKIK